MERPRKKIYGLIQKTTNDQESSQARTINKSDFDIDSFMFVHELKSKIKLDMIEGIVVSRITVMGETLSKITNTLYLLWENRIPLQSVDDSIVLNRDVDSPYLGDLFEKFSAFHKGKPERRGRPRGRSKLDIEVAYIKEELNRGLPVIKLAKNLGVSRATLHNWIKQNKRLISPDLEQIK